MGKLKYCKHCGKASEFTTKSIIDNGGITITTKCSNCGYEEKTTKSNTHYGNDSLNK